MARGDFVGLPVATLNSLRDKYVACLEAIAVAGASYSIAGRSFSRANLSEVREIIAELTLAIENASGTRIRTTYAKFGP
ncbi:MAG: hypothetical protein EBR82_55510 [Caulobacteraceae bacterium]|nr:hypothetical protein [Caulobacteraceae bacterium]